MMKINSPRLNKTQTRFSLSVEITSRRRIKNVSLRFNNKPHTIVTLPNVERGVVVPIDWGDFPPGAKLKIPISSISEYKKFRNKYMECNSGIGRKSTKRKWNAKKR